MLGTIQKSSYPGDAEVFIHQSLFQNQPATLWKMLKADNQFSQQSGNKTGTVYAITIAIVHTHRSHILAIGRAWWAESTPGFFLLCILQQ